MSEQIPLTSDAVADLPHPDDGTREIAANLAYKRLAIVNVVFLGTPQCGDGQWVLVDAGVIGLTGLIESAAEERFGAARGRHGLPKTDLAAPQMRIDPRIFLDVAALA